MDNVARGIRRCLSAFLFLIATAANAGEYTPLFKPFHDKAGHLKIAIRKNVEAGKTAYLSVDPYSFGTSMIKDKELAKPAGPEWKNTPYGKALIKYTAPGHGLQDSGLVAGNSTKGLFLTVDLCPSHKPLDTELFEAAMKLPAFKDRPVPIAIAVSGLWMDEHKHDMDWVLGKIKEKRLKVTWVNHSWSHPYDFQKPIEENFLLKPGVDFEKEVLEEERALLQRGVVPSPFFRFPGLVADRAHLERLKSLSLIPIGANAWLAKGEEPGVGSVILVHGNGNEPEGIRRLLEFFDGKDGNIELRPLEEAFGRK